MSDSEGEVELGAPTRVDPGPDHGFPTGLEGDADRVVLLGPSRDRDEPLPVAVECEIRFAVCVVAGYGDVVPGRRPSPVREELRAEVDPHGYEPAVRDARQQVLTRLAGADEHGQELLVSSSREAALPRQLQRGDSLRIGRLLLDAELVERHSGHVDRRARDRLAARVGDVEPRRDRRRPTMDDGRLDTEPVPVRINELD